MVELCELVEQNVTMYLCMNMSEGGTKKSGKYLTQGPLGVVYRINFISSWITSFTASSTSLASKVGVFDSGNDDRCRGS